MRVAAITASARFLDAQHGDSYNFHMVKAARAILIPLLLVSVFFPVSAARAADGSKPSAPADSTTNGKQKIQVNVNLVPVLFTVVDKKKHLVLGLTKNDFQVFEDNKPQTISYFTQEANLPLRIGVLIDTSNSIRLRLGFEKQAAIDFLNDTVRPGEDKAFVVSFDVEPELLQDYTDDVNKLSDAIRELQAGGGTGLFDAIYFACKQKMMFSPPTHPYLRRVLIIVSDGRDNESQHSLDEALAMAQRAQAVVFAISTNRSGLTERGDKVLKYLAEQTGGKAYFPFQASDLAAAFHEIG
ncbi:MAG: VWA domain-containing protein [Terriglobia bacterium]